MTYSRAELRVKIVQCQMTGMTARQAAEWLGVSVDTLNDHRRRFGLPPFERPEPNSYSYRDDSWTPDDEALLACCIEAGCSLLQTKTVLRRSRWSVMVKRTRLGLPRFRRGPNSPKAGLPAWHGERLERLRDLYAKRVPYSQIAARLGVTRNAIAGAVRDHLKPQQEVRP